MIQEAYEKGIVLVAAMGNDSVQVDDYDPADYQHMVGDPPTDLNLHPNSAGYRLILNNILFPAAKKKKQKT